MMNQVKNSASPTRITGPSWRTRNTSVSPPAQSIAAAASAVPGASPDLDPNAGLPDGVHAAMSASRPGQLVFALA